MINERMEKWNYLIQNYDEFKEDEFLKAKDGLISIMNNINKCLENPDIDVLFKIEFGFSLSRNDLNKLANLLFY